MSHAPVRKAHLSEIMILIAAIACGLTLVRYYVATPHRLIPTFGKQGQFSFVPSYRAQGLHEIATAGSLLLAAWSPALVWAGLRAPRRDNTAMVGRPGLLVMSVATAVVVAFFGWHLWTVMTDGWPVVEVPASINGQLISGQLDLFTEELQGLRTWVGPAVAATWLALIALGRGKGSADWVERSCRALSAAWVLVYLESFR